MKILDLDVDPMKGFGNMPRLILVVDKLPDLKDLVYKVQSIGDNTLYWAEKEGYVSFFLHNPKDESGFGGRVFTLLLESGEKIKIAGPWSSRSSVTNIYFPHSVECAYHEEKRELTAYAGNVLVSKVESLIEEFRPEWFLFGYNDSIEIRYSLFPIETKDKLLMVKGFQALLDLLLQAERYIIYSGDNVKILNHYRSKKMITGLMITKEGIPTITLKDEDHGIDIILPFDTVKIPIVFQQDERTRGIKLIMKSKGGTLVIHFEDLYSGRSGSGRWTSYSITKEEYMEKIRTFVGNYSKFFKLNV